MNLAATCKFALLRVCSRSEGRASSVRGLRRLTFHVHKTRAYLIQPTVISSRQIARVVPNRHINVFEWYRKNAKTPGQVQVKKELEQGYWWEYTQLQRNPTGKIFPSDQRLLPTGEQLAFPPASGRFLSKRTFDPAAEFKQAKCTLVIAAMHRFVSGPMVDEWVKAFEKEFSDSSQFRCIEVDYISDVLYSLAGPALQWSAGSQVGSQRLDRVAFVYGRAAQQARDKLGLANRVLPYVFLVDSVGRVRWRAVGKPDQQDIDRVAKFARKLAEEAPVIPQGTIETSTASAGTS